MTEPVTTTEPDTTTSTGGETNPGTTLPRIDAGPPAPGGLLGLEQVATGFDSPVFATAAPGEPNRLYVVEQGGRIRILEDGQVVVLDELRLDAPKTKPLARLLQAIGVRGSCLIGTGGHDKNLVLSARNIPGVSVSPLKDFNALDVINARTVVLTREAFEALQSNGESGGDETEAAPGARPPRTGLSPEASE